MISLVSSIEFSTTSISRSTYLNYTVKKLERTRIMNVSLRGLAYGEWRELTSKEVDELNDSIKDTGKDAKSTQDSLNTVTGGAVGRFNALKTNVGGFGNIAIGNNALESGVNAGFFPDLISEILLFALSIRL